MADTTYSVKIDEEIKERIKKLIDNSGQSSKSFFEYLISIAELQKAKETTPILTTDIEELELLTKRINSIFTSISERVNILYKDNNEKIQQSQKVNQATIELLQQKINTLETNRLNDEERIALFISDKKKDENKVVELLQQIKQLENIVNDKESLINEYKEKLETLTSIVNEYKSLSEENKKLQSENVDFKITIDDKEKQIILLNEKLIKKAAEYEGELELIKNTINIQYNKKFIELERNHQKELFEQQETYSKKINEYETKILSIIKNFEELKSASQTPDIKVTTKKPIYKGKVRRLSSNNSE